MYADRQPVSGSPFTMSILPLVSPLRLVEASSSGLVGRTVPLRVSYNFATFNLPYAMGPLPVSIKIAYVLRYLLWLLGKRPNLHENFTECS